MLIIFLPPFLLLLFFSVTALLALHHLAVIILLLESIGRLVPLNLVRLLGRLDRGQLVLGWVLLLGVHVGLVVGRNTSLFFTLLVDISPGKCGQVLIPIDFDRLKFFIVSLREPSGQVMDSLGEHDRLEQLGITFRHLMQKVLVQTLDYCWETQDLIATRSKGWGDLE